MLGADRGLIDILTYEKRRQVHFSVDYIYELSEYLKSVQ